MAHHAHAVHADRPPHVAHHFDSAEQQHASAKLGMWLFLTTEILLFSGLFVGYAIYRAMHPEIFTEASKFLDVKLGALNTAVLIGSSLTMALAVRAAQLTHRRQLVVYLAVTLALAGVFLVVKYFEYEHKLHLGVRPGQWFNPHGEAADLNMPTAHMRTFFSIYYIMTGLHGFHVVGGMAVIAWLLARARRNEFSSVYYTPVETVGLYWHLVDMIWIYLFPLLYLIR